MPHRSGFLHAVAVAQREAERKRIAQQKEKEKAETQIARVAEKARKDYERAVVVDQKERVRLYAASRIAQVDFQNEQLERQIKLFEHALLDALAIDSYVDLQKLKQIPNLPTFNPGSLIVPEPPPLLSLPAAPSAIQKILPGTKEKHAQEVLKAQEDYQAQVQSHRMREAHRQQALAEMRAHYEQQVSEERHRISLQHNEVDTFQQDVVAGVPQALVEYFTMVLASSSYPDTFPQQAKLAYVPESKQLVIEYNFPRFEVVPEVSSYKYVKTKDTITEAPRAVAQRKILYTSIISQVTLRTLYELFKADRMNHLDTIVFNGYVDSIDKGTGQTTHTCLITIRTNRDVFAKINLSQVDAQACLTVLNASVSKSPAELAPVRPVLEFNMVDPRFVEEIDVLFELDQRPNLMDLTPTEFESLITNLFQKMGLETRQTQASRDGGVDCVAFDPRPIFGGKVVIQAKRYKNTVGVSAVRDLYGTMQNEGASKGILVATSGYGKASFEFAEGKPLELLSGSNLLFLLKEHAGIEAKIIVPDIWKDPQPDA